MKWPQSVWQGWQVLPGVGRAYCTWAAERVMLAILHRPALPWVGLCMAVLLLAAAVVTARQARQDLVRLRMAMPAVSLHADADERARGQRRAREQGEAWQRLLLPADEVVPALARLLQLARQCGVELQRGDYRAHPQAAGGFVEWTADMPVAGEAAQVELFLRQALAEQPALGLERMQIVRVEARGDAVSDRITAQLGWILLALPDGESKS